MGKEYEKPALIDTNVLVYAYAEDSPKRKNAAQLLAEGFKGNKKLAVSLQNLGEFCAVATGKYALELNKMNEIAEELLKSKAFTKISYGEGTFHKAIALLKQQKLGFWDALLIATMREQNINKIYTEDSDFNKVKGIKAVNPF